MKNILYILFTAILLTACNDDFLDREPLDKYATDAVFRDEALVKAYFSNLQGKLPYGIHGRDGSKWGDFTVGYGHYPCMISSTTDESRAKSGWVGSNKIVNANVSPTADRNMGLWDKGYAVIRQASNIIAGVEGSSFDDEFKAEIIAKTRYVRAFYYFDLVRRYGDVPLIIKVQSFDDNLLVSRTPKNEIYDFIYKELNEILSVLENKSDVDAGEINKQAAIALNARAMLYAKRWKEAASLADRLITGDDNDGIDLHNNYEELFRDAGGNKEVIMEKLTDPTVAGMSFAYYNYPMRWRTGWGGQTNPTQEFVDSYEMANGLAITDPASGYNPARPYDGRDPRFYVSIFYHGSEFAEVQPAFGEPVIDMEWNNGNEGPGPKKHGAGSLTGYLVRKFMNPAEGFAPGLMAGLASWKEMRFAEVLLIYAEAENEENGPSDNVYSAVNRIRARAGMPNIPGGLNKDEMRQRIRQERKIELAFENHRWWDLIRWEIAHEVLDGYVPHGMKVERKSSAPSKGDVPQLFDPEQLTYTVFEVEGRTQSFPMYMYLWPIYQSELDKNPNLTQNPGY